MKNLIGKKSAGDEFRGYYIRILSLFLAFSVFLTTGFDVVNMGESLGKSQISANGRKLEKYYNNRLLFTLVKNSEPFTEDMELEVNELSSNENNNLKKEIELNKLKNMHIENIFSCSTKLMENGREIRSFGNINMKIDFINRLKPMSGRSSWKIFQIHENNSIEELTYNKNTEFNFNEKERSLESVAFQIKDFSKIIVAEITEKDISESLKDDELKISEIEINKKADDKRRLEIENNNSDKQLGNSEKTSEEIINKIPLAESSENNIIDGNFDFSVDRLNRIILEDYKILRGFELKDYEEILDYSDDDEESKYVEKNEPVFEIIDETDKTEITDVESEESNEISEEEQSDILNSENKKVTENDENTDTKETETEEKITNFDMDKIIPEFTLKRYDTEKKNVYLDDFISSINIERYDGEKWTETDSLYLNDEVKANINYKIDSENIKNLKDNGNTVIYKLPSELSIMLKQEGKILDDTKEVGDYVVDTDGEIRLIFNGEFLKDELTVNGKLNFKGLNCQIKCNVVE